MLIVQRANSRTNMIMIVHLATLEHTSLITGLKRQAYIDYDVVMPKLSQEVHSGTKLVNLTITTVFRTNRFGGGDTFSFFFPPVFGVLLAPPHCSKQPINP